MLFAARARQIFSTKLKAVYWRLLFDLSCKSILAKIWSGLNDMLLVVNGKKYFLAFKDIR